MILRRLQVRDFRTLSDFSAEFHAGLNVIRGPNEAGKSTLQAAIVDLLFTDPGRDNKQIRAMQPWGSDALPVLAADFASPERDYSLVKDFAARRVTLTLPDGKTVADRGEVGERMAQIVGLKDPDVYLDTACLRQQQWARLDSGADLKQLLQESLTGGGQGVTVQAVLRKLAKARQDLERGVKGHAPVNPGPLAQVRARAAETEKDLRAARQEADSRTRAEDQRDEGRKRLEQLTVEAGDAEKLRERADRCLAAEKAMGEAAKLADDLDNRLRLVERLEAEIAVLEQGLTEGPQVDRKIADEVSRLSQSMGQREADLHGLRQELRRLAEEPPAAGAEEAAGGEVSPQVLERARNLEAEAREARQAAAEHGERAAEAAARLARERQRLAPRPYLLAAGLILIFAGVMLGALAHPALFALFALGVPLAARGMTLRPLEDTAELQAVAEAEEEHRRRQEQRATDKERALQRSLAEAGVDSMAQLAAEVTAGERRHAERIARAEAARREVAAQEERIRQAEAHIKSTEAQLQGWLRETGFGSVAELVERVGSREEARQELGRKRERLQGLLGDQTREALEQIHAEHRRLWLARRDELESPELASAHLSPEAYQALLSRISRMEQERAGLEQTIREAEMTVAAYRHDADDVRKDVTALEGQWEDLRAREALYQERLRVVLLAEEVISQAQHEALADTTEAIGPRIGELLSQMTEGRYREVVLDGEALIPAVTHPATGDRLNAAGGEQDLSCATREQVFLAARLALVDMLWPTGGPPLLLDDPLVNFDPARRKASLEAIKSAAGTHQVLLFTCTHDYDSVADHLVVMPGPPARPAA